MELHVRSGLCLLVILALAGCNPVPTDHADVVASTNPTRVSGPAGEAPGKPALDPEPPLTYPDMRWFYDEKNNIAAFGPPQSEWILSFECKRDSTGERGLKLLFDGKTATKSAQTMTIRATGKSFAVPINPLTTVMGDGVSWEGFASAEAGLARALAAMKGDDRVTLELDGAPALILPNSDELQKAVSECQ